MEGDARLLSRVERVVPAVASLVLVAGLIVFFVNRGGNAAAEKTVPLARDAKLVAMRFIRDAVQRRAPGRSFALVTPSLRRGYSFAQWRSGKIPVVPYPAKHLRIARFSPKYSYSQRVLVAVDLASRKLGVESFEIGLVRRGGRWLVSLWQPVGRITPSRS